MKNKLHIALACLLLALLPGFGQVNTFSPYSRYGLGEIGPTTFAHNMAMGGAYIALKPDSLMPIFINAGNPAAYALIRLTSLEVGGSGIYSNFKSSSGGSLTKWTTNFAYGSLGFPVRGNGGAAFGIMPYSNVGYDLQNKTNEPGIGSVQYLYSGSGGLNKAFIGYGFMPFNKRLAHFRRKNLFVPDSMRHYRGTAYRFAETGSKLLSDFSIGFNANYIFGSLDNNTRVVYPNSVLYNNTYRDRALTMGAFTGNFGLQTAITFDSTSVKNKKNKRLLHRANDSLQKLYTGDVLKEKLDSVARVYATRRRAMSEKIKITFGYFMNLNNPMTASYNSTIYNYILNGDGSELIRDTVLYHDNQKSTIRLPLEQGFGIGFKKGERINVVLDYAITNWQNFKYLDNASELRNNHRIAAGINFVPDKYAAGANAFIKRVNYRMGFSYQTGYINIQNSLVTDYAVSAGLGLPVGKGRLSSMVNLSVQLGQMGANTNVVKQNYLRFSVGFTFCDRWFQKFRYD